MGDMTWAAVTDACAAFLGAFTGVAFLALVRPTPPRHPKGAPAQPFPLDDADNLHRGTADRSQHIRPGQGEL